MSKLHGALSRTYTWCSDSGPKKTDPREHTAVSYLTIPFQLPCYLPSGVQGVEEESQSSLWVLYVLECLLQHLPEKSLDILGQNHKQVGCIKGKTYALSIVICALSDPAGVLLPYQLGYSLLFFDC